VSSNAHLVWEISLITAVVAGIVLGFVRAWWLAMLGAVQPVILVVVAQFVSNDTLPGTEDMSWRIVLVVIAVEVAVLFFSSFAAGVVLRAAVDFLRRRTSRTPSNLNGRSA
jgi:type VI protein secretion system component VasK